jgi:hypothetical protein
MKKSHVQETSCSDICHGASGRAKIEDQVDEMPTLLPIVNVRIGDAIPQTILAGPFSLSPPEVLQLIFAAFALYATLPPTNARTDSAQPTQQYRELRDGRNNHPHWSYREPRFQELQFRQTKATFRASERQ